MKDNNIGAAATGKRRMPVAALVILAMGTGVRAFAALPATKPSEAYHPRAQLGAVSTVSAAWHLDAAQASAPVWQAFEYQGSGALALAAGPAIPLVDGRAPDDELRRACLRFAEDNSAELGMGGCQLQSTAAREVGNYRVVTLQPSLDGIPVYGGFVVLSVNRSGALALVKAQGFGSDRRGSFGITEDAAVGEAARTVEGDVDSYLVERYWLPRARASGEVVLQPCYLVAFHSPLSSESHLRPAVFVNADDGSVIASENRVCYDRLDGEIDGLYKPLYERDESAQSPFADEWLRLSDAGEGYTDGGGEFSFNVNINLLPVTLTAELRGRWVDVDYEDGPDARFQVQIGGFDPVLLVWDDNRSREDERNLYFHVNFIHSYWKGRDPDFDELDYPMLAVCQHGDNFDNAYWNGEGIFFGGGGQMGNFAMFADIIWHEYGHAVTSGIYSWQMLPYTGESGALNEAWSDYFPCSISDEPLMGEGGLNGAGYIRNLDNNLKYPGNIVGEVHADSRIISAAMWHTREQLGSDLTDSLVHFARYQQGTDFLAHFTDILLTDDDNGDISDGTPDDMALYEQFGRHGIGPGLFPDLQLTRADLSDSPNGISDGDGDQIWEPGETVAIEVELHRDGSLFPPPARDVVARLTTDHPGVEPVRGEVGFGDLYVGDDAVAEPLLFRIAADAPLSFARLFLTVSRAEGDTLRQDTIRIPLGNPPLLLVRDGEGAGIDRTPWFEEALDSIGVVYEEFWTEAPTMALGDRLPQFPTLLWFTGDDRSGILTTPARYELERYLDNGGRLLLTGQSLDRAPAADQFFADYLGTVHVADSLHVVALDGVEGDPISGGLWLLLLGWGGAHNQLRPSGLQAVGEGVEAYIWRSVEGNLAGAVRREDPVSGARTIYLGFGLEAVGGHGDSAKRWTALGRMLDWLGVPNAAPPVDEPPSGFSLAPAYPNPFNQSSVFSYQLSVSGEVNLSLYDISGRLLRTMVDERQPAGGHQANINGEGLASGVYLIKLLAGNKAAVRKVVCVK